MADGGEAAAQQEPMIALTFDDGPDSVCTPMLLDGLKARGVKATSFLIGENIVKDGNQKIVKRMEEEGHLIGNHTYHHVDLSSSTALPSIHSWILSLTISSQDSLNTLHISTVVVMRSTKMRTCWMIRSNQIARQSCNH